MQLESRNDVVILSFPEEPLYPRLGTAALEELSDLLTAISKESVVRGVVIAANSCSFATGANIDEISALDAIRACEFARKGQALCRRIRCFPKPLVAAIRGFCSGGGLDLALACHGRIAAYNSSFSYPGGALGLITGWGGTQSFPRKFSKATAFELLLTGERIPATQAISLGLVDELASSCDLVNAAVQRLGAFFATHSQDFLRAENS